MRKAVKIGFIGVFCAVIGLAFPVFNIFSKQLSMDSHENRLMTGLPQVLQSPLRELPGSRWCSASAAGSMDQNASFPSSHGLPLRGASARVSGSGALRYRQYNSTAHTAAVRNAKKQRRQRMRRHLPVHTLCVGGTEYFPCTLTGNSGKEYTKRDILRGQGERYGKKNRP